MSGSSRHKKGKKKGKSGKRSKASRRYEDSDIRAHRGIKPSCCADSFVMCVHNYASTQVYACVAAVCWYIVYVGMIWSYYWLLLAIWEIDLSLPGGSGDDPTDDSPGSLYAGGIFLPGLPGYPFDPSYPIGPILPDLPDYPDINIDIDPGLDVKSFMVTDVESKFFSLQAGIAHGFSYDTFAQFLFLVFVGLAGIFLDKGDVPDSMRRNLGLLRYPPLSILIGLLGSSWFIPIVPRLTLSRFCQPVSKDTATFTYFECASMIFGIMGVVTGILFLLISLCCLKRLIRPSDEDAEGGADGKRKKKRKGKKGKGKKEEEEKKKKKADEKEREKKRRKARDEESEGSEDNEGNRSSGEGDSGDEEDMA